MLENPVFSTIRLLECLKIKFTRKYISESLQNHPNYPSLLSISDTLIKLKIESISLKTSADKLSSIPVPFVTLLNENGEKFITVTAVTDNSVTYFLDSKKAISKPLPAFLKKWNPVVLIAETTDESGETDYVVNKQQQRINSYKIPSILILGVIFFIGMLTQQSSQITINLLIRLTSIGFLKLAGVTLCSLLLWYEIDSANPILKKICSVGNRTNCDSVLNSAQAKVFGMISWSEIGFFYFAGGLLFLLFSHDKNNALVILGWLNLIALPYTIFSVYYQWRIVKQWCILCLSVQAALFSEFLINIFTANQFDFELKISIFSFLFSFLLPVICWYLLKPIFLTLETNKSQKRELNRFKYDTEIFNSLLPKQKLINKSINGIGITIGNPDAANTIIKVCSPYCGPCARAHPEIEKLIHESNDIKAQIIFTASEDEYDEKNKPISHLLAIASLGNAKLTEQALDNWYSSPRKNYELFAEQFPIEGGLSMQSQQVKLMSEWCKETGIAFTPTFFINGYQLPDVYHIEDLKYLLA